MLSLSLSLAVCDAVILGYEGVFDVCYKVKLDNGLFKEAVPEEEVEASAHSEDVLRAAAGGGAAALPATEGAGVGGANLMADW